MSKTNRRFGWIPDLPDYRDVMYSVAAPAVLPTKVDLRDGCPIVYNQGSLGSCTAQAIGGAHQFNQIKAKAAADFIPSRLFIYWNEREMINTINEDSGAMIRDGIKSVVRQGVCHDTEWPYDVAKFTVKPPEPCYVHALNHQVLSYQRVSVALSQIKTCLASGYPIVFGFTVYESFQTEAVARTGMMPMPAGSQLGGHAVMAVGYDDSIGRVIVRNSWGADWGDAGYFYMPYEYIANSNLCDDF
jgi:C1A family cysteine protease